MSHPANTKKLFTGVMITVFAGMLILGVADPARADSFHSGKFTLMDFDFPCFGSGSFKAKFVSLSP
jgi:hypothetical protein